jgi:hypothetical protein
MYTLPQGCSAKREIILDDLAYVQNFIHIQFYLKDKGAARFPEG